MAGLVDELVAEWRDEPLWVLYLRAADDPASELRRHPLLRGEGTAVVYQSSSAVTVVGRHEYASCIVVEYPSPAAFGALLRAGPGGLEGLAACLGPQGYCIPVSAGWLPVVGPPEEGYPEPLEALQPIDRWDADRLQSHGAQNEKLGVAGRSGPTFATLAQANHFATDPAQGSGQVWMLNLVQFSPEPLPHTGGVTPEQHDSGEAAYAHYGQLTSASAEDDGPLIQHAGRAMYSSQRIFKSLVGESDFDRMMLIQYPSRDHYLSMGAYPSYVAAHPYREQGLSELYIVSTRPMARGNPFGMDAIANFREVSPGAVLRGRSPRYCQYLGCILPRCQQYRCAQVGAGSAPACSTAWPR